MTFCNYIQKVKKDKTKIMPKATKKVSKEIDVGPNQCRYMTRSLTKKIEAENRKKGQTGSRECPKKPEVSRKEEASLRFGPSTRPAVRRPVSPTMPKLFRSPAIISRPVQAAATEPSSETRELQDVTSDLARRVQNLEVNVNAMHNHLTEVLPAQIDDILVHSDSLVTNLRERFVREVQDLRDRTNVLIEAMQQPQVLHTVEVTPEDYRLLFDKVEYA